MKDGRSRRHRYGVCAGPRRSAPDQLFGHKATAVDCPDPVRLVSEDEALVISLMGNSEREGPDLFDVLGAYWRLAEEGRVDYIAAPSSFLRFSSSPLTIRRRMKLARVSPGLPTEDAIMASSWLPSRSRPSRRRRELSGSPHRPAAPAATVCSRPSLGPGPTRAATGPRALAAFCSRSAPLSDGIAGRERPHSQYAPARSTPTRPATAGPPAARIPPMAARRALPRSSLHPCSPSPQRTSQR